MKRRNANGRSGSNVGNDSPPTLQLTKLDKEIASAIQKKSPYIFASGSIVELADRIGVDRNVLTRTIDNYNACGDQGRDDEFGKDPIFFAR